MNIPREALRDNQGLAELVEAGELSAMLLYWELDTYEMLVATDTYRHLTLLTADALATMQQIDDYEHRMDLICGLQSVARDHYDVLVQRDNGAKREPGATQ